MITITNENNLIEHSDRVCEYHNFYAVAVNKYSGRTIEFAYRCSLVCASGHIYIYTQNNSDDICCVCINGEITFAELFQNFTNLKIYNCTIKMAVNAEVTIQ